MPDREELKPCPNPACKSTTLIFAGAGMFERVQCEDCYTAGPGASNSMDRAIDLWNALPREGDCGNPQREAINKLWALKTSIEEIRGRLDAQVYPVSVLHETIAIAVDQTKEIIDLLEGQEVKP